MTNLGQFATAPCYCGRVRAVGLGGCYVRMCLDEARPGLKHACVGLAELCRNLTRIKSGQHATG